MKPFYYILGAVALIGVVFIAMKVTGAGSPAMAPEPKMAGETSEALVAQAKGVTRGDPNSSVKVMVFSDYMCPGCAIFATQIEPQIRATYGERVTEIYHDFPLVSIHKYSFLAARAGRCAEDQSKFWEMHDVLFAKQRDWSFAATAPVKQFTTYAGDVGLDTKSFGDCLRSDKHADVVSANLEMGERVGVGSTPTVYINGRMSNGAMDWNMIKAEIDQALGTPASAPSTAPVTPAAPATTGQ